MFIINLFKRWILVSEIDFCICLLFNCWWICKIWAIITSYCLKYLAECSSNKLWNLLKASITALAVLVTILRTIAYIVLRFKIVKIILLLFAFSAITVSSCQWPNSVWIFIYSIFSYARAKFFSLFFFILVDFVFLFSLIGKSVFFT